MPGEGGLAGSGRDELGPARSGGHLELDQLLADRHAAGEVGVAHAHPVALPGQQAGGERLAVGLQVTDQDSIPAVMVSRTWAPVTSSGCACARTSGSTV